VYTPFLPNRNRSQEDLHLAASHVSVLLVESRRDDRQMYAEFLRAHEFTALEVETTDDGLQAARNADVIVTGIRVRGSFDGIELVRRLRRDDATKNTPLIVLTACAFEPDQSRAHTAGCDVFLPKPCLPETLLSEIEVLVARARALRSKSTHGRMRAAKARLHSQQLLRRSRTVHDSLRRRHTNR
jgi:DNA-binding response OmpR family regulator